MPAHSAYPTKLFPNRDQVDSLTDCRDFDISLSAITANQSRKFRFGDPRGPPHVGDGRQMRLALAAHVPVLVAAEPVGRALMLCRSSVVGGNIRQMEFTAVADRGDLREERHGTTVKGCIRIYDTDDKEVDVLTYPLGEDEAETLVNIRDAIVKSRYHTTGVWSREEGCFYACLTD